MECSVDIEYKGKIFKMKTCIFQFWTRGYVEFSVLFPHEIFKKLCVFVGGASITSEFMTEQRKIVQDILIETPEYKQFQSQAEKMNEDLKKDHQVIVTDIFSIDVEDSSFCANFKIKSGEEFSFSLFGSNKCFPYIHFEESSKVKNKIFEYIGWRDDVFEYFKKHPETRYKLLFR